MLNKSKTRYLAAQATKKTSICAPLNPLSSIYAFRHWLYYGVTTRNVFGGVEASGDVTRVQTGTPIGKPKARTVIIQVGTINNSSPVSNTQAGQRNGSAGTVPDATPSNTATEGSSPW